MLLDYFKEYCWNNFLHSELEKALHLVFYNGLGGNNTTSIENIDDFCSYLMEISKTALLTHQKAENINENVNANANTNAIAVGEEEPTEMQENHIEKDTNDDSDAAQENPTATESTHPAANDLDKTKTPKNNPPTEMQTYVSIYHSFKSLIDYMIWNLLQLIVNCQLVNKLVFLWRHNAEVQ